MSCARYFNPRLRARILAGDEPAWLTKHPRRTYIVRCIVQCPPWVDRKALQAKYAEARQRTLETGVKHVCDHIAPLDHWGLHVPWNLRIVPYAVNASKGSRWYPDQIELFEEAAA